MTAPAAFRLRLAADILSAGGVIAHPTEAVWGLCCLPDDEQAVQRVLDLKQRDPAKGLILVADSESRFAPLLEALSPVVRQQIRDSWPGPTTWVLPDPDGWAPALVRGKHDSVAVRVSDHSLTASLSRAVGSPIVSTSANPSSRAPAMNVWQARRYFGAAVDYYLNGATGGRSRPSTIVDARGGGVLRK